ncbi:WD40-repeat-containing domain protein [Flammula alnicola]|nr:WD40-repeat-containing domain protein [Flammula alnicola]
MAASNPKHHKSEARLPKDTQKPPLKNKRERRATPDRYPHQITSSHGSNCTNFHKGWKLLFLACRLVSKDLLYRNWVGVSTLAAPTPTDGSTPSDALTSAVINPHNAFQLFTGSLDGRIMIWDFVNATLLQTISIGQPIHYMCVHEQFKGSIFVAASRPRKKPIVNDNNAVVLQITLKHSDHTTSECLAFHPFEEYFATGDDKGVVRLWYCLNDDLATKVRGVEKRTQTKSLHWHAHAVSSISFTPNGAYLLSGGEESVLVIWQLHTGKKEFVPRLGAPINTVSISTSSNSEEEYLVGLADETYTFVSSASLKITRSYSRIKIDPALSQEWQSTSKLNSAPIAIQPLTSTLVLPSSHPSSLQMYSPSSSTLICELEVSPSNRVSRRDEKPVIPSRVETAVISSSGTWMATVDSREGDAGFRSEVYLKIWSWDTHQGNWILNTRIDRPHGIDKVTDVSFTPCVDESKYLHLVTTGNDGHIKVWRLWRHRAAPGSTASESENGTWVSFATLTYRSEIPTSISWSPDASLFAVSVGPHIAVYDAAVGSLCQTLTSPNNHKIHSVHFIGTNGRHLLASGLNTLVMWDLIDSCVAWQCDTPHPIDRVVPHQKDASFAVFHSPTVTGEEINTRVSIFRASSNIPTSIRSVPFGLRNVVWASFNKRSGYNLVGVTHSWRVVMISDSQQPSNEEGLTAKGINVGHESQRRTLFQDIFGVSAFAASNSDFSQAPSLLQKHHKTYTLFDTPAYLAPSLDSLFDPLVKSLLTNRPTEPSALEDRPEDDIEEDAVMEEEQVASNSILSSHPSRSPHPGEMEAFTKLFKARCMTGTPTPPPLPN